MKPGGAYPLRRPDEGNLEAFTCAVVLVRISESQFHLGLGRADDPTEPVLHLAWHRRLRDEPLVAVIKEDPAATIRLALDPLIDETLQILSEQIATKYANRRKFFVYGFGEVSTTFDRSTGEPSELDPAFTCATFVLALLRSVGVTLLDAARWRDPTPDDLSWQRDMRVSLLESIAQGIHGADLPYAKERLLHDLDSRRYRPTDVAGASLLAPRDWPVSAVDVEPHVNWLKAELPWREASMSP